MGGGRAVSKAQRPPQAAADSGAYSCLCGVDFLVFIHCRMGIIFQEAGPFRKKGKGTPMSQEKGRDFIQNIIITVLFLLAVALFAKTQMESLGLDERQPDAFHCQRRI